MTQRALTSVGLLVAIGLGAGCVSSQTHTDVGAPLARQITQSQYCGVFAPGHIHIANADSLRKLESATGSALPLQLLENIDYQREHVILAALGQKPTGGYGVVLERSEIRDDVLHLTIRVKEPDAGSIVTQALTTPCAVIAVTAEGWDDIQITRAENNR